MNAAYVLFCDSIQYCMTKDKLFITKRAAFLCGLAAFILFLLFPEEGASGFRAALRLCCETVAPTVFPLMILTTFLAKLGLGRRTSSFAGQFLRPLFGVSGNAAPVFLFGSTGGYVTGVKTAKACVGTRILRNDEAARSALINVNPGIGFAVLTTGVSLFGSAKTGALLYAATLTGNTLTGILLQRFPKTRLRSNRRITDQNTEKTQPDIAGAFVGCVRESVKNVAVMCGWILLFSSIFSIVRHVFPVGWMQIFFEVTGGAVYCKEKADLPLCAFTLAFGGICLWLQLFEDLRSFGVGIRMYFFCRTLSGAFSYLTVYLFMKLFPAAVAVSVNVHTVPAAAAGGNVGLLTALVLMCVTFMVSLSPPAANRRT